MTMYVPSIAEAVVPPAVSAGPATVCKRPEHRRSSRRSRATPTARTRGARWRVCGARDGWGAGGAGQGRGAGVAARGRRLDPPRGRPGLRARERDVPRVEPRTARAGDRRVRRAGCPAGPPRGLSGGSARGRPAGPRVGDRRVRAWETGGSARGRPESHVTDRDPALRAGIPREGAGRAARGGADAPQERGPAERAG